MSDESSQYDRIRNLWAPWRMQYIKSLKDGTAGCFICRSREDVDNDPKNLVLWRGRRSFAMLNRFPYTGGHALVAPLDHVGELRDLDGQTMQEILELLRDCQAALSEALDAQGFNIGMNVGRCAGAGLPEHLHVHIVPRWVGDTNFMTLIDDVRVIPVSLDAIYTELLRAGDRLGLPKLSACGAEPGPERPGQPDQPGRTD